MARNQSVPRVYIVRSVLTSQIREMSLVSLNFNAVLDSNGLSLSTNMSRRAYGTHISSSPFFPTPYCISSHLCNISSNSYRLLRLSSVDIYRSPQVFNFDLSSMSRLFFPSLFFFSTFPILNTYSNSLMVADEILTKRSEI